MHPLEFVCESFYEQASIYVLPLLGRNPAGIGPYTKDEEEKEHAQKIAGSESNIITAVA
jgi:hypothetical protein